MTIERIEHDGLGQIAVPASVYWGAQTARRSKTFRSAAGTCRIAKEALATGRTVRELAEAKGLSQNEVTAILSPGRLVAARREDWERAVEDAPG